MASATSAIPAYAPTALEDISTRVSKVQTGFRSNKTKDIQFRLVQLRKLYWGLVDNEALIEEALLKDMRKSRFESRITEIDFCKTDLMNIIKNLEKWAKDEPVVGIPLHFKIMNYRLRHEPYGTVLVIGSYNYPIQLNLCPVFGAIAAGNTVVLKASELSPNSAMVLAKIFDECLDPQYYTYINGAIPETQQVLNEKFDKIVFTGGKNVGRIVAQKAAETLTPVLLELGGQNPAFVTKNANVKLAARRLLWQKCLNAGQVCLSHNYILVERSVMSQFIGEMNKQLKVMMPKGAKNSPDFSRVVNINHYKRLKKMLDSSSGKIVMGGAMDEDDLFIEPTMVLVEDVNDSMIIQESFGPIWSIMPFDSLDQAIEVANGVDPTPLSLFAFGTDAENDKVLNSITSGGAGLNDSFIQCQVPQSPIGGVGGSGTGSYHGYYSFKAFSHQRAVAKTPSWAEGFLRIRYMPYSDDELKRFERFTQPKPDFDRNGQQIKGLKYFLSIVLRLGGTSSKGALLRWAVLFVTAAAIGLKNGSLGPWMNK